MKGCRGGRPGCELNMAVGRVRAKESAAVEVDPELQNLSKL